MHTNRLAKLNWHTASCPNTNDDYKLMVPMNNWRAVPKLTQCVRTLLQGGVIAYPTEAVWGLGCDPDNDHAVEKILRLKKRPVHKGLILVAASIEQLDFLLHDLEPEYYQKLEASWPGANTWLIPHKGRVSPMVTGKHATVAVRVSNHPIVKALCQGFGGPIVSTSANPMGLSAAKSQMQVRRYFAKEALSYATGVVGGRSTPSVIRDLYTDAIIRA